MRILLTVLLLALWPRMALAEIKVRAEYHAPTDLFSLMEETALLYPWSRKSYRDVWSNRFGWADDDRRLMASYKRYRLRTADQTKLTSRRPEDGLFARRASSLEDIDPLAYHFFSAESISDALATLDKIASAEDAAMLRSFYQHFQPGWTAILEESEAFSVQADALNEVLSGDRIDAFLERMAQFYHVDTDLEFTTRLVWWPPINRTAADLKGRTFLLYRHPERHVDENDRAQIAMHEAAHFFSGSQPADQKLELTNQFLEICPITTDNRTHILEEPLAVAWGQAAFAKYGLGRSLSPSENWYHPPIPDVMGRLLWLHVDEIYGTNDTITDGLIVEAAQYCARILEIGDASRRQSESWWPFK